MAAGKPSLNGNQGNCMWPNITLSRPECARFCIESVAARLSRRVVRHTIRNEVEQQVVVERLFQDLCHPELASQSDQVRRGRSGDQRNRQFRALATQAAHELQPGLVRHVLVHHQTGQLTQCRLIQELRGRIVGGDRKPRGFQQELEQFTHRIIVVDHRHQPVGYVMHFARSIAPAGRCLRVSAMTLSPNVRRRALT